MWWGNAVFAYHAHPLVRVAGQVSRSLANAVAVVAGLQPKIRIYPVAENREQARRMFDLRRRLYWIAAILLALLVSLAARLAFAAASKG